MKQKTKNIFFNIFIITLGTVIILIQLAVGLAICLVALKLIGLI